MTRRILLPTSRGWACDHRDQGSAQLILSMKPKATTPMIALDDDERREDRVHLNAANVTV